MYENITTTTQASVVAEWGDEIVAAHRDGRIRHTNGASTYFDTPDGDLVAIDHSSTEWVRYDFVSGSPEAVRYQAGTGLRRPDSERADQQAEFFAESLRRILVPVL